PLLKPPKRSDSSNSKAICSKPRTGERSNRHSCTCVGRARAEFLRRSFARGLRQVATALGEFLVPLLGLRIGRRIGNPRVFLGLYAKSLRFIGANLRTPLWPRFYPFRFLR